MLLKMILEMSKQRTESIKQNNNLLFIIQENRLN